MSNTETSQHDTINNVLNVNSRLSRLKHLRWLLLVVVLLLLSIVIYLWAVSTRAPAIRYQTSEVIRGGLIVTVTATGTLQPVNQVDVGSELSGIIKSVHVDFNDRVQRGQVQARLGQWGNGAMGSGNGVKGNGVRLDCYTAM